MKITVACGAVNFSPEILGDEEGSLTTLGELRDAVVDRLDMERGTMKLLHRGKQLAGENEQSLDTFGFKENDKVLVMGAKNRSMKDDPGFSALLQYEKNNLNGLQGTIEKIEKDLGEIEKGFLEETKQREMAKQLDKRLKMFNEHCERHLEAIDGLQAQRNREKRKSLVSGIQKLLNLNDTYVRRLEEYQLKLDGKIVE